MPTGPIDGSSRTQPLSVLGLSVRAYNALQRHGVRTVEQLSRLRELDVWQMRQVGIKTATEILAALATSATPRLEGTHPLDTVATPRLCLREEWSLPAWVTEDFAPVSSLGLSTRARRALDRFGIQYVAEVVLLDMRELLGMRGVGSWAINDIRLHLTEYATAPGQSPSPKPHGPQSQTQPPAIPRPADVSYTFSEVISLWMKSLKGRDRSILTGRLGLDGKAPRTLKQLGQKYHITPERARQIAAKGCRRLVHLGNGDVLYRHCSALYAFLSDRDGLASAEEVRRDLGLYADLGGFDALLCCQIMAEADDRLRWFPSLGLLSEGSRDQKTILTIRREVRKLLPEESNSLPLGHLLLASATSRSFQERCGAQDEAFLIACLRTDPEVTMADGVVTWPEHVTKAARRVFDALQQLGVPAHCSEITAQINADLPADGQVTQRDVYGILSRYRALFVRTGRGTYGLTNWESTASSRRLELT